ncbi:MAG: hypothetical protein ACD_46C00404G0001, partial [uncultured bacterium]
PHQTLTLVLPVSEKKMFVKHLAAHKKMQKEIAGKSLAHYSVKHGDSLGGIALEFKTTIKTLQKINQLHDGIIRIHQVLLVPRLIAEADKNLTTTKVASQKKTYHVSHKNTYYTVKPGDHLWGIAAKMHVSHAHIEAWNHINARTSLRIGEKLVVSEKITRVATATHKVFSKNTRKTIHATKKKEHLFSKHEKKTKHLAKAKHKVFSRNVKKAIAGHEHLYIVKRGDELHHLAAEFHTTTYHIMQHNHLKTANLSIGEHLQLPNA